MDEFELQTNEEDVQERDFLESQLLEGDDDVDDFKSKYMRDFNKLLENQAERKKKAKQLWEHQTREIRNKLKQINERFDKTFKESFEKSFKVIYDMISYRKLRLKQYEDSIQRTEESIGSMFVIENIWSKKKKPSRDDSKDPAELKMLENDLCLYIKRKFAELSTCDTDEYYPTKDNSRKKQRLEEPYVPIASPISEINYDDFTKDFDDDVLSIPVTPEDITQITSSQQPRNELPDSTTPNKKKK